MGNAVGRMLGLKTGNGTQKSKKNLPSGGNRKQRKKKDKILKLRQLIAKAGNEIFRRKCRRKATKREKEIIEELGKLCSGVQMNVSVLLRMKEPWLEELRYEKCKLEKDIQNTKKRKNKALFETNESKFYREINQKETLGQAPTVEEFVNFWAGIWEGSREVEIKPWMVDIERKIAEKVKGVKQFNVTKSKLAKTIKKRKNWSAPGIDGIQNFWWKQLNCCWDKSVTVFENFKLNPDQIPAWFMLGRTVLLPKTEVIDSVDLFRPITCLNTVYKIYTGMIGEYLKEHSTSWDLWDDGQMGARSGVLGTVDQLLIDGCIMGEVVEHRRNLTVAYYDYKKAYDNVLHGWIVLVLKWMKIPQDLLNVIIQLMSGWKTRLEIKMGSQMVVSRWINIFRGFLQGDSFSPVGYCLTVVPIGMLISVSDGYVLGKPGDRSLKRTHSLLIDDLKVYQKDHEKMVAVNEIIVTASLDTGATYGIKKCAEIVIKHGSIVKGEGLDVLGERMHCFDPEKEEHYKFLGVEQGCGFVKEVVLCRILKEIDVRTRSLSDTGLHDRHLMKALKTRVIPVAAYVMNMVKFSNADLHEMDAVIKRALRENKMLGKQSSDERLYMSRKEGGRGLKSFSEVYKVTKIRVACYMIFSDSLWIQRAWERECSKECWSIKREAEEALREVGSNLKLSNNSVELNGQQIDVDWKKAYKVLKKEFMDKHTQKMKENYLQKVMQSDVWGKQNICSHKWLQRNLGSIKTASIVTMLEQMVETNAWKVLRGQIDVSDMCRLCKKHKETVHHLVSGCTTLAGKEYLQRHNKALMVFAVSWAVEVELLPKGATWFKERWESGKVLENENFKLRWDFDAKLMRYGVHRRPDLWLENKNEKKIWIVDMACPMEMNLEKKVGEKLKNYKQLAFETREKRPNWDVRIIPLVVGSLGGVAEGMEKELKLLLGNDKLAQLVNAEMVKIVLMESESIVRAVLSSLIQPTH